MTDDEKEEYPVYKEIGGYLKRWTYEEAWANWWNEASQEDRDAILNIPQFNASIFKEITGIDVEKNSLSGKEVEVTLDGKTYKAVIK